jgi:hypothetical protein
MTCKVLYGGVHRENNPAYNSDLYRFPETSNGYPSTFIFANEPYVEASVGIANILKFFRVDAVKRFTYLNHPNVSPFGVRVRLKFDF